MFNSVESFTLPLSKQSWKGRVFVDAFKSGLKTDLFKLAFK